MTANTAPKSALDGLVSCGQCGAPMSFREPTGDQESLYLCVENHRNNGIEAHATDRLIISNVLEAVMTGTALQKVETSIKELNAQDGVEGTFPIEDITLLREDPYLFLRSVKGLENARNFLSMFIDRIMLFPDRAMVHYALSLPPDSRLAGKEQQEIRLKADLPA